MEYLYKVLPFLKTADEKRRRQFEEYFMSAPIWLLDSIQIIHMEKDTMLVKENNPADTIYFVGEGVVKAVDYRVFGISYDFMRFDDVYAFGGLEVLTNDTVYQTTLQTATRCTIVKIPRSVFEKWLNTDARVLRIEAGNVAAYLLEQGRNSRACLFLQGADRLIYILQDMYVRYQKNGILAINHTRKELSDLSGLCIKTINRSVKKLEENGWITRQGTHFTMDKEQYKKCDEYISALVER